MIYLIHCNKIRPWTDLCDVAEWPHGKMTQGTCPTCKSTFTYSGRAIVGFEASDYFFCLACVASKETEFLKTEPVFASKRNWRNTKCDCCGERLEAGLARKYAS
jgi:hypothetical protein